MIYGVVIEHFGYTPMFISWVVISVISIAIILLVNHLRRSAGLVTEA
jgi:ABC-type polysaccharide transport system permease subunit